MSNRKLVGTEFRNEFLRSLNILAPRIAAAIERYGSDPLIVDSLKVNDQLTANSATFSAGVQIDTTLTLKDIGTHADTPASGFGVIYVNGDVPYFKDDGGTATSMIASGGGSGSPGGSDTQIQYNNGGSFGGVASLTFDDSSGHLTVIDDKKLQFGTGNDASIEYDEDGNDVLAIDGAATKFTVAGVEIENGSTTGAAALTIDNDDTDQIALSIDAANIDADVIDIAADAVTTANVMDVSADALTSGAILNLVSDSNSTTARSLVKITNDNTASTEVKGLEMVMDSGHYGIHLDHNYSDTSAQTIYALNIDFDKTGASTSNNAMYGIFLDMDNTTATNGVNNMFGLDVSATLTHAANAGTANVTGATITATAGTNGSGNAVGMQVITTGGDNNTGLIIDCDDGGNDFLIRSSADTGDLFKIQTTTNGATTITTVDDDANEANLTFTIDGFIKLDGLGVEIENDSTSGTVALLIDNDDTDQRALAIEAANINQDVIGVTADAVTTANVMDVTADALTTGGILNLVSDSSDTSARTLVIVKNDNTAATSTVVMHLINDAIGGLDDPILLIESTSNETHPVLELKNSNASTTSEPILIFTNPDDTAEADDMKLGQIQFKGVDSGNNATFYAQIKADATDITSGDEGGEIKFIVMAGGTAGTAAVKELLTIGGEDVANSTNCAVIVNEAGIDCDFRVESEGEDEAIFLDANANALHINKGETAFETHIYSTNDVAMSVTSAGVVFNEDGHATNDFRVESDNITIAFGVNAGDDTIMAGGFDSSNHKDGFAVFNDFNATTFENKLTDGQFGSAKILRYSPGADDTLTAGQLFFLHTDGTWDSTDADAVATGATQMLGIGLGGSARTVGCLIKGFIRIPSTEILNLPGSGACDGLPLYVSTTAGHLDFTAPSGNGDFVRIVGYAIDDDGGDVLIYFSPDATHVEITA